MVTTTVRFTYRFLRVPQERHKQEKEKFRVIKDKIEREQELLRRSVEEAERDLRKVQEEADAEAEVTVHPCSCSHPTHRAYRREDRIIPTP